MRRIALMVAITAVSTMAGAAQIHPTGASAVDELGVPTQPQLGKPFWVALDYQVDAGLTGPYRMTVDGPYTHLRTGELSYGLGEPGNYRAVWGPVVPLTAGPLSLRASILTSADDAAEPATLTVTPTLPSAAIELYSPRCWRAEMDSTATFAPSASPKKVQWLIPSPPVTPFQSISSLIVPGGTLAGSVWTRTDLGPVASSRASITFQTNSASVRSNPGLLRAGSFAALKRVPKDVSVWLKHETLVESGSSEIRSFVAMTLGKGYQNTMSPYGAAETLFQSVVERTTYADDGSSASAVRTLRSRVADCGGFSSLFVAACRGAGIPARCITGFTAGSGQWHVWAEVYLPGAGWLPCDPAYAKGARPQGDMPVYFGVIPDLNARVATAIGFDHSAAGKKATMLQSPMAFLTGKGTVTGFWSTCSLSPAGGQP